MVSKPARLVHLPAVARILWAFTRQVERHPNACSRRSDLYTLAKVIWRGWARLITGSNGTSAFIIRDGEIIHALYVHPDRRGTGQGKMLISEAKTAESQLELWTDQNNLAAIDFYQSQGFGEAGRSDGAGNDEQVPDIQFVWRSNPIDQEVAI